MPGRERMTLRVRDCWGKRATPPRRPVGTRLPRRAAVHEPSTTFQMTMRPRVCLLCLCLFATPAAAQDPDSVAVEDVTFAGVRALDPALLRAAIETRESTCASPFYAGFCALGDADWAERRAYLNPAALPRDEEAIRRTYALWGYPAATARASVDTLPDGDVRVRFEITEGGPLRVRDVVLRGTESLPSLTAADLPIRADDVYALPRIQAAQRVIARRFGERGHAFVQVAPLQVVVITLPQTLAPSTTFLRADRR